MNAPFSQVSVIGRPQPKTWDDYERGCLDNYAGGHHNDGHLDAFQHGMSTVFNLLRAEFPSAEQCKAAPELLEALQALLETPIPHAVGCSHRNETCTCHKAKARAALAKATGDT